MRPNAPSAYQNPEHPLLCNTQSLMSGALHYLGMALAVLGTVLLLRKSVLQGDAPAATAALGVYGLNMILLYAASATYHTFFVSETVHRRLRKADHCMIYLLVAGTYTPVCFLSLGGMLSGRMLLIGVWTVAVLGILLQLFYVDAPRWLTTASYIALGWAALFAIVPLYQQMPLGGFVLLLVGGLMYTVGGVFYGLKIPRLHSRWFGAHEFFHVLILLGSVLHYGMVYSFVA